MSDDREFLNRVLRKAKWIIDSDPEGVWCTMEVRQAMQDLRRAIEADDVVLVGKYMCLIGHMIGQYEFLETNIKSVRKAESVLSGGGAKQEQRRQAVDRFFELAKTHTNGEAERIVARENGVSERTIRNWVSELS